MGKIIEQVVEGQTKYCWNCKHGEEWCDSCINYSGWEPLDTKRK